jgi:hypothetical protein
LTSKLFDIKILQTIFANPVPSKAFRGMGGGGVPRICTVFPNQEQRRASLFQQEIHSAPTANSRKACFPVLLTQRMIVPPLTHPHKEITMKKFYGLVVFVLLLAPALFAQEHYTEGPIWRVTLIRVKPNQMDAYLTSLRQSTKSIYEESKKQGSIIDYKVFLKETKNNPEDWDICIAVEYKNHAALDGLAAKGEAVRDKVLGGKAQSQQLGEKRAEIREIVSSELLQEIFLK